MLKVKQRCVLNFQFFIDTVIENVYIFDISKKNIKFSNSFIENSSMIKFPSYTLSGNDIKHEILF